MSTAKSIHVLMIEDMQIAQMVAIKLFEQLNCKLKVVSTATQGFEEILQGDYDIIFIDIQLPNIDGLSLAKVIREIEIQSKPISVIAVTAHFSDEIAMKAKDAGCDDFLEKPLNLESVREVLLKHLPKTKIGLLT